MSEFDVLHGDDYVSCCW